METCRQSFLVGYMDQFRAAAEGTTAHQLIKALSTICMGTCRPALWRCLEPTGSERFPQLRREMLLACLHGTHHAPTIARRIHLTSAKHICMCQRTFARCWWYSHLSGCQGGERVIAHACRSYRLGCAGAAWPNHFSCGV